MTHDKECESTLVCAYDTYGTWKRAHRNRVAANTVHRRLAELGTQGVEYKVAGFARFQGGAKTAFKPDSVEDEFN